MSRNSVTRKLGVSVTGFAAKRPRLVVTLVLLLALVAAQGSVAAATDLDGGMVDTSGSGTVNEGP